MSESNPNPKNRILTVVDDDIFEELEGLADELEVLSDALYQHRAHSIVAMRIEERLRAAIKILRDVDGDDEEPASCEGRVSS